MDGTCSTYGEMRNAYTILVRKSVEKISVGQLGTQGRDILKRILKK
jgi:hypothetical protein